MTLMGHVVNAGLAWALIYGRLGLPALGVRGAGLATAIVEVLQCAVLLGMLLRDERRPSLSLRKATSEVLDLGLPLGLHFGMETAAFTTFTVTPLRTVPVWPLMTVPLIAALPDDTTVT